MSTVSVDPLCRRRRVCRSSCQCCSKFAGLAAALCEFFAPASLSCARIASECHSVGNAHCVQRVCVKLCMPMPQRCGRTSPQCAELSASGLLLEGSMLSFMILATSIARVVRSRRTLLNASMQKPPDQRKSRDHSRDMPLGPVAQSALSCCAAKWPGRELNPRHADFQSVLRGT
jgi:hypothetical protein